MSARTFVAPVLVGLALVLFPGCQTTDSSDAEVISPSAKIVFTPRVHRAVIQAGEGRYPNLFTTASFAVWGGEAHAAAPQTPPVSPDPAKGDAATEAAMDAHLESVPPQPEVEASRAGGLTIECHLESEFPDRSIAYDAVGLRGMTINLRLPDGRELQPAQKTLGSELEEVPVGALRRYGRKLTLYFSEGQFMVENPAVNPKAAGVQLRIVGLESQFLFDWPATPDFLATPKPRPDQKAAKFVRKHLPEARSAVARTSHTFD